MTDYRSKYNKYKNKYLQLKKQVAGAYDGIEWFELRKHNDIDTSTLTYDSITASRERKITEGGQSSIYLYRPDTTLLVRTIPKEIDKKDELLEDRLPEDILNEDNFYNYEVYYSKLLSNIVKSDINPHFVVSAKFANSDGDSILQLLEKFDGDITNASFTPDVLNKTYLFEQLLFGLVTLLKNNIIITDVNKKNILYKQLNKDVKIIYKIDGKTYHIITNTLYVFADYGMARPQYKSPDMKGRNAIVFSSILDIMNIPPGIPKANITERMNKIILDLTGSEMCKLSTSEVTLSSTVPIYKNMRSYLLSCMKNIIENIPRIHGEGETNPDIPEKEYNL